MPILESAIEYERNVSPPIPTIAPPPLPETEPPQPSPLISQPEHHSTIYAKTFDQDPTNLVTCYAASLEKCNFDATPVSVIQITKKVPPPVPSRRQELTGKRGEFVCTSTPNLSGPFSVYKGSRVDDFEHHNSLKDVTTTSSASNGILATNGSRSKEGLIKGVSFCPIVSEISWKDTNVPVDDDDEEDEEEDDVYEEEETDSDGSDEFEPVQMTSKYLDACTIRHNNIFTFTLRL